MHLRGPCSLRPCISRPYCIFLLDCNHYIMLNSPDLNFQHLKNLLLKEVFTTVCNLTGHIHICYNDDYNHFCTKYCWHLWSYQTWLWSTAFSPNLVQINLFQKHLFFHQLTHNMTKDCPLNYEFSTWKLRTFCVHKLFWILNQKRKNNLCTQHVLSF